MVRGYFSPPGPPEADSGGLPDGASARGDGVGRSVFTARPAKKVTGRFYNSVGRYYPPANASFPIMSQPSPVVVLVAEDDEADYEFLKCMLRETPLVSLYRVSDGEQAMNYLEGRGSFRDRQAYPLPDILLLDLNLPKISGLELLERMAGQPAFAGIRISVLSGSDSTANRERALGAGAHDYFIKPLSLGHIAALFSRREAGR
jgi:CheY-like chemotaxis protein